MAALFNTILIEPLYNLLVLLSSFMPGHNIALAIIALTLLVKIVLFPLQHKAFITQTKMKHVEGDISKIKKETKDPQEQTKKMLELYKMHGINPFSSFLLLLIQLPILLAVYWVFRGSFDFDPDLVYSFVSIPDSVNTSILGLAEITERSFFWAALTGITQFFQSKLMLPPKKNDESKQVGEKSFKDDLARSMQFQMRYIMPVFIVFIAATLPAAIALYWVTSNLFAIAHEVFVKRKAKELLENGQLKTP